MTDEESETRKRIHAGYARMIPMGVDMDWSANYGYGLRAFLRDKRALKWTEKEVGAHVKKTNLTGK